MGVGMESSKEREVVGGANGPHRLPHLSIERGMRGEKSANENSQHTGKVVACRLSWAVELVIDLGALRKIGVALAQSRAHAWLRFSCHADILLQRNGGPKRNGGKYEWVRLM